VQEKRFISKGIIGVGREAFRMRRELIFENLKGYEEQFTPAVFHLKGLTHPSNLRIPVG
jgi:hypothetical protein